MPALQRDALSPEGAAHYDRIAASSTGVRPFGHLLHSPDLAERYVNLTNFFREASMLSLRERELITLVVAHHWGSSYIWGAHRGAAERAGVARAQIDAIEQGHTPGGLDEPGAAMVAFVTALLRSRKVPDQTFDTLTGQVGQRGAVEVTLLAGYYTMQAHTLAALDMTSIG